MNNKQAVLWILLILLVVGLTACGQTAGTETAGETAVTPSPAEPTEEVEPETTPPAEPRIEPAEIESLEVITQDMASGVVLVRLRGLLANDCARIDDIVTDQQGSDFSLTVLSVVEPGENCSTDALPFEEIVELDVTGLQAGTYNVAANERQVSFELADEESEPEPTQEPSTTEESAEATAAAGTISGVVWHDSCANIDVENSELPAGCVLTADNVFLADGILDNEEGIAGVEVAIGEGTCPAADTLETMLSDEEGAFAFDELVPGDYCLFIDMTRTQNQGILGSGSWTVPADSPEIAVSLAAGEALADQNFGWDFLNLPAAGEVDLVDCSNSFEFVADLNIPRSRRARRSLRNGNCAITAPAPGPPSTALSLSVVTQCRPKKASRWNSLSLREKNSLSPWIWSLPRSWAHSAATGRWRMPAANRLALTDLSRTHSGCR
jgi:hypothetical protein